MSTNPQKRIYLDHAATSFPKAPGVAEAIQNYLSECGASAGRGAYQEAFEAKDLLDEVREDLADLIAAKDPKRLIFTLNASDALNLALKGILKLKDHVVVSGIEHNSVCRPLHELKKRLEIEFTKIPVSLEGELDFKLLEKSIRPTTRLLAFLQGSNVSGTLLPLELLSDFSFKKGIPLLVDASQTLGAYPLDVTKIKIDLLAFPGHKSLLGPLGTGGLWVREGLDLQTLKEGGTGSFSEEDTQPKFWPDIHESGSHNLLGIAGLGAALKFLKATGVEKIRQHKENLLQQFMEGLKNIPSLKVIAAPVKQNAGVISLQHPRLNPQEFALALDAQFRIQVRPGLHCAPWAHQTFGTYPQGTVRMSIGYSNTVQEVEAVLKALRSFS
ncbi:MAG: aminotransferase class V-fold PLP-dependent enzyme [Deltaproteobacteria bacterium]|nr:aminotransferase class V-fold PLP-dependent enzyme [Deltaproteobacteria bacterium]